MGENDQGYSHRNAVDKGIQSVNVSAGTEMPDGNRIIKPMGPINQNPHNHVPQSSGRK